MLRCCGATDVGGRPDNEDFYSILKLEHKSGIYHLLAVADGVWSCDAGEIASELAVMTLLDAVRTGLSSLKSVSRESLKELLKDGFRKANDAVCDRSKSFPEGCDLSTTLVAALLDDNGRGAVANVGDSRAYLVGDEIVRVTKDHSFVQELIDAGMLREDKAFGHPHKNIVTKVIGMRGVKPDLFNIDLGDKDILILCSDGISDVLREEQIKELVLNSGAENICKHLIEVVKPISYDNITVIAARVE
ncbi:MAG: serine/threonine protein phosphatase [Candidatus Syntrophoarchaeum caldarius]|uniref:Serine/threonine protein phosphatase n=1 Tax=Candidatus Syntropharchaeum caldarium TaxID=1838285 RepID=A0A1F2P9H1_9EURY|nr:MAG: serine/threonine protein phosphatase [Candidatus Syntrophoarchaeum caldarius]